MSSSPAQRERRDRMLNAAMKLASDGGYEAVQMREVADDAGVALGTLYRYFPSKVHLLVAALASQFEQAEAITERRPIVGDTAHERVMPSQPCRPTTERGPLTASVRADDTGILALPDPGTGGTPSGSLGVLRP